jgi:hypothetical protein
MRVMHFQERCAQKVRLTRHKRIPKLTEMNAILHFICEDVGGDVVYKYCLMNPLAKLAFAELNVMHCFWCHAVRPSNAGIVVIVDSCSLIYIRSRNTRLQNTPTKFAEIDNLFRRRICGPNLRLEGKCAPDVQPTNQEDLHS